MLYGGECMDRCKNDCGFYGNVDKIFDGLCSRCYKAVLAERQHRTSVTSRTSKTSISSDHGDAPPAPAVPKEGEAKPKPAPAEGDKKAKKAEVSKDNKTAADGTKEPLVEESDKPEEVAKESA